MKGPFADPVISFQELAPLTFSDPDLLPELPVILEEVPVRLEEQPEIPLTDPYWSIEELREQLKNPGGVSGEAGPAHYPHE